MIRPLLSALLVLGLPTVHADPITAERIAALPEAERGAWENYLKTSQATAQADQAALDAEVKAAGLPAALKAPEGGDFKLPKEAADWYKSEEAKALADIILSYQAPSGGWSKHTGYTKGKRQPGMLFSSQYEPGGRPHYLATIDNRSTTAQLYFLANLHHATSREDARTAFGKGVEYLLAAQNPNGGWPQTYPLEGGYHDDITYNDDADVHVLELLQSIGEDEIFRPLLTDEKRAKVAATLASGVRCLLATQIVREGKKTVWCAQHDAITLKPTNARAMEPASLSGGETTGILKFLMSVKNPSPEVIASIEAALAWLDASKVTGIKKTEVDGKTSYVADSSSTEIYWARFNSLETGKPIFPGRDRVQYESYEAMAKGNKIGYDYYTTLPNSVLGNGQKKWRKTLVKK